MARAKTTSNGRLEDALATLIQNQASFLTRMADMDRIGSERFARIETFLLEQSRILAEHSRILSEHTRILQALPEAIRRQPDVVRPQ